MNKFVTGALAMAAAGSVGFADPGDSDWLELDSEINSLASSLTTSQGSGSGWSALLRSTYTFSGDDILNGDDDTDTSGISLDDIDIAFWGNVGEASWRVSFDADNGDAEVEDAFVDWMCGDQATIRMGMFKPNVTFSQQVDPENQLFIDRPLIGSAFDFWDHGAGAHGSYDQFNWSASFHNGNTSSDSSHFWVARLWYGFGAGPGNTESAQGAGEDLAGGIGLTIANDDTTSGDANGILIDGRGTMGNMGLGFEFADLDDDANLSPSSDVLDFATGFGIALEGDTSPMAVWFSYVFNPEFEGGIRYQDTDNGNDDTLLTLGVNWYQSGNNHKWQFDVTDSSSDTLEGTVVQASLVVGATR